MAQLLRKNVPEGFCKGFCCAHIADKCRAMGDPQKCLWTSQKAAELIAVTRKVKTNVPREVQAWGRTIGS